MAWAIPWNMFGLSISGDVGDFTIYSDRYMKPVVFPRSPPKVPHSEKQRVQRERWSLAMSRWNALTPTEKQAWQRLCRRAGICMEGVGLYLKMSMNPDYSTFATLFRQTGLGPFNPPEYIPREDA